LIVEDSVMVFTGHTNAVGSLAWLPTGKYILSSGKSWEGDSSIRVWEPARDVAGPMNRIQQVVRGSGGVDGAVNFDSVGVIDWSSQGNLIAIFATLLYGKGHQILVFRVMDDGFAVDTAAFQEVRHCGSVSLVMTLAFPEGAVASSNKFAVVVV
jgi:WD40 repeat protein